MVEDLKSQIPQIIMLANAGHKPLDTRIFHKEAIFLKKNGWDVTIIIPHTESFEFNGIKIISVPLPKRGWHQLIVCPWNIFWKSCRLSSLSVFHIHDSELLLVGIALRMLGRQVIYDAHEDTPLQITYQHWIPTYLKKPYILFYRGLENLAGRFFTGIIVAEPVIAKYFPSHKVTLIRNFPIASSFHELNNYSSRQNRIVYVGLLSKARGVVEMLEGYKKASQNIDMKFIIGGKFAPTSLENELLPHYSVDYRQWLSYSEMVNVLNESRVGIIVPHPIERYRTNYPVKLFEYMAAGLPVIASKEGEPSAFVKEADGGILVDPENDNEIASAMIKLITEPDLALEMGQRGRKLILEKYNWEIESQKLIGLYNALVNK